MQPLDHIILSYPHFSCKQIEEKIIPLPDGGKPRRDDFGKSVVAIQKYDSTQNVKENV